MTDSMSPDEIAAHTSEDDSLTRAAAGGPIGGADDTDGDSTYSGPAETHDSEAAVDELRADDPEAAAESDSPNPRLTSIYGQVAAAADSVDPDRDRSQPDAFGR